MIHFCAIEEKVESEPFDLIVNDIRDIECVRQIPSQFHPVNTIVRLKSGYEFYVVRIESSSNTEIVNETTFNTFMDNLHKLVGKDISRD